MTDVVESAIERVTGAGALLRAASDERVLVALEAAVAALGSETSPVGREARTVVAERSGLSPLGACWALDTTLAALSRPAMEAGLEAMRRALAPYRATPVRAHALVLAGNVFTACLRPIVWSLLARVPTLVKVATLDEGLAELFGVALSVADPELGAALAVLRPHGASAALVARLASRVDLVSAHGGDHAIAEMRGATSPTTDFVGHGHGLGAIVVRRTALSSQVSALALAIAEDVAAYDQRGCLSPQMILVERGGELGPREVASLVASEGLAALARSRPRGTLPIEIGAQQVQWRGLASALHELFEGDGYATTFEQGSVRPTPGYRNIAVHGFDAPGEVGARLAAYGPHLKVVGLAGEEDGLALPPPLSPRICAVGEMQRPSLLAATDGLPPWHGLARLG